MSKTYPYDYFVQLEGDPYHMGRITVTKTQDYFNAEINLVNSESQKIFSHVSMIFQELDEEELLQKSIQRLSEYLEKLKKGA